MATIRQRGEAWQAIVRIRDQGRLHSEARTFSTERLARAWADGVERSIKLKGVPSRKLNTKTFGDLLDMYAEARSKVKALRRGMLGELGQLSEALGHVKLAHMKVDTLTKWAMERRAVAGPATVLHNLSTIRSVLASAEPMFGLEVDTEIAPKAIKALSTMGAVSKSKSRERRASDAEINALVAEFERIAGNPSTIIPMATIVRLAVALPRRLGELTTMTWRDWNESRGTITLRGTKNPKEPRIEIVPVPPAARKIIEALPKIDERILPYKGDSVSAAFDRACERLKIEDMHFHDLRHEGISRLFEAGLGIHEVALISGHTSWAMLRRYTHIKPEDVLEKLNARPQAKQEDSPQPA